VPIFVRAGRGALILSTIHPSPVVTWRRRPETMNGLAHGARSLVVDCMAKRALLQSPVWVIPGAGRRNARQGSRRASAGDLGPLSGAPTALRRRGPGV